MKKAKSGDLVVLFYSFSVCCDVVVDTLVRLLSGWHLVYLLIGVYVGLVMGVLPALGGSAGMAILLPFVFGMEPTHALPMMIGMMAVTPTADTFPSVLMGIPGGNSLAVDGAGRLPDVQARRGRAGAVRGLLVVAGRRDHSARCSSR